MDEQDKTKKIFSLDELNELGNKAIKEITGENDLNKIKEAEETEEASIEPIIEKSKKKNFFAKMSKKQRIIFITIIVVSIMVIGLLLYFFVFKKDKNEGPENNNDIVIKKENYRYENGVLVFLDGERELGSYKCNNKLASNCYLASYNNQEDKFNVSTQVYEDLKPIIEESDFINNQYAFVIDVDDSKDQIITIYDFVNEMKVATVKNVKYYGVDNLVIVESTKGLYGLYSLDTTGFVEKIDCVYNYLGMITEGKDDQVLVAKSDIYWSLIGYSNETITKNYQYEIKDYNSEYVVLSDGNYNYLYDYKNKMVFNEQYSYIRLMDEYVAVIKDLNLNIYDYEGNKYNEAPIVLPNSTYNKMFIYGSDGTSKGVKGAFDVTINGNIIKVAEPDNSDKYKVINTLEGKLSKLLGYANYFDGVYYFYKDSDKTEKIGEYTCTNKNEINDLVTEDNIYNALSNCYIAYDSIYENNDITDTSNFTIGAIPIFNETFVFMNEVNTKTSAKTIKLHNLKTNKTVGTYNNVSTYTFTGINNISFVSEDEINIIARNKDNKMGMITINKDEVKGAIPFTYLSLEKLGSEYYLAKTSNARYQVIFNNSGTSVSKELPGPVKGYNSTYFKVLENNKYQIYDYEGNKINNIGFKYVELETSYYIGVDDSNELKIYNYENEEIISEGITLNSSNYAKGELRAFKTELNGSVLTISVLNNQDYLEYDYDITTGLRMEG